MSSKVLTLILRDDGKVTLYDPNLEDVTMDRSECWPEPTTIAYVVPGVAASGERPINHRFEIRVASCVERPTKGVRT